jgi:hypothetical protein
LTRSTCGTANAIANFEPAQRLDDDLTTLAAVTARAAGAATPSPSAVCSRLTLRNQLVHQVGWPAFFRGNEFRSVGSFQPGSTIATILAGAPGAAVAMSRESTRHRTCDQFQISGRLSWIAG